MHDEGDALQGADAVPQGGVVVAQEDDPVVDGGTARTGVRAGVGTGVRAGVGADAGAGASAGARAGAATRTRACTGARAGARAGAGAKAGSGARAGAATRTRTCAGTRTRAGAGAHARPRARPRTRARAHARARPRARRGRRRADDADAVDAPGVGLAGQPAVLEVDLDRAGCARGDAPGLLADDLSHQGQGLRAAGDRGEEGELVACGGAGEAPVAVVAEDGVPCPGLPQHPLQAGAGQPLPQLAGGGVVGAGDHRLEASRLQPGRRTAELLRAPEDGLHDQDLGDAGGVVRVGVGQSAAQSAPGVVDREGDRALTSLERLRDVPGQPGGERRLA
ncbi:hypothetical protein STANM337S_04796 [Streptomyces tanashiensis]